MKIERNMRIYTHNQRISIKQAVICTAIFYAKNEQTLYKQTHYAQKIVAVEIN